MDADLQLRMELLAPAGGHPEPGLAVVVLARDEGAVLRKNLPGWAGWLGPADGLHIVADQCQDDTAAAAREAGAIVHVRPRGSGLPGKGAALRWWLARTSADEAAPVVILDADSRPGPDFFEHVRAHLASGEPAVQVRLEPRVEKPSPLAALAALSDRIEHQVFDPIRSRLGWAVRLRGTGMAFQRPVLERAAPHIATLAEDIELTLLLTAWGIPIAFCADTFVEDVKPEDASGAARQRARWLRGQMQVLRRHHQSIFKVAMQGPAGLWLLSSTLGRPKSLLLPSLLIVAVGAFAGGSLFSSKALFGVSAAMGIVLAVDLLGLVLGFLHLSDRGETLRILLGWPGFARMWLRSLGMSISSRDAWPSARRQPTEPLLSPTGRDP